MPASTLLFIINAGAGSGSQPVWQDSIRNYFTEKPYIIDYFLLEEKVDTAALKKYILSSAADKVIAVGGDGTINMIAGMIAGTGIPLGILPAGSANGMAKELGIPNEPDAALQVVEHGDIKKCDTIFINNKYTCLHLSDIGLNAQLIKFFDEGKLRGKLGYARMILKTLWHREKMKVLIHTKEMEVRRLAFMVVLANASKYGTGAVINPEGKIDDGEFEVIIVRRLSVIALLKMLVNPGPFDPKHIEIFSSTSVEINTVKNVHFQVDGEYMGKIRHLSAKVVPGHIGLILPPATI
jgi:diacylglycerol kinase (ATP)